MKTEDDVYRNGNLAPGVHYREKTLVIRPPLQTGVPLFVGFGEVTAMGKSEKIDAGQPVVFRPKNQKDFERSFSAKSSDNYLDYAIRGFFENGGDDCVVVSLPEPEKLSDRKHALEKAFEERGLLEDIDNVDLVCVPDIMGRDILGSPGAAVDLQRQVLAYCRRMEDRFAILDAGFSQSQEKTNVRQATTADERQELVKHALDWHGSIPEKGRAVEGAVYFPWILVKPLMRHKNKAYVSIPPCGHLAGIYARSDREFGVQKAPANEIVEGATDLEFHVSKELQAELNTFGINCLRSFPGRGIRVWGARTLSSQINWRYINVRRLFLTFFRWIMNNLDDMLFEPNESGLWDNVTDRIGSYCYELYQRGALQGLSPDEAYFVKCDAETNPGEVREAGQLICEVGMAPALPAEFVVVRIVRNLYGTTAILSTSS